MRKKDFEKFYDSLNEDQRREFNKFERDCKDKENRLVQALWGLGSFAASTLVIFVFCFNSSSFFNRKSESELKMQSN